jgi:hypothetical protein
MESSERFKKSKPTEKQFELLSKITNPEQKKALLAAIESGEEIPGYAWAPIPDSFTRDKLIETAMEARKAGEKFRKMEEERISPLEPIVENQQDLEIVYGEIYESLAFIPKKRALELAQIHYALQHSKTWGEFKSRVPQRVYDSIMQYFRMDGEPTPEDVEPFSSEKVPGYLDGDFPGWPAQEMLAWVPEAIQEEYGSVESSAFGEPCFEFDPGMELEIVSALQEMSYRCNKDEKLVREACGFHIEENDYPE